MLVLAGSDMLGHTYITEEQKVQASNNANGNIQGRARQAQVSLSKHVDGLKITTCPIQDKNPAGIQWPER